MYSELAKVLDYNLNDNINGSAAEATSEHAMAL